MASFAEVQNSIYNHRQSGSEKVQNHTDEIFIDGKSNPFLSRPIRDLDLECWNQSLYRSRAGSHFYGTEYEIWADFGPVGNTEKKIGGRL